MLAQKTSYCTWTVRMVLILLEVVEPVEDSVVTFLHENGGLQWRCKIVLNTNMYV